LNWLGLDYRDPLFGIIFLFAVVFAISFLGYSFKKHKEKTARAEYYDLLKRFEFGNLEVNDYIHLYLTYKLPFETIILLSNTFVHKGDYNKAISLYLALLEHIDDRLQKEELLENLGKTYFKTGLLQRSKDIFLQILKFSPRNKNALKYLLLTYERLKDFENAMHTLEPLIELNCEVSKDRVYLKTEIILADSVHSIPNKIKLLNEIYDKHKIIERVFISFLIRFDINFFWQNIEWFDLAKGIDILWYMPKTNIDFTKVKEHKFLNELYNAKQYLDTVNSSDIFELDILILAKKRENNQTKIDLNFEYICQSCKKIHPIYSSRCPSCNSVLGLYVSPKLTKVNFEKNNSLQ